MPRDPSTIDEDQDREPEIWETEDTEEGLDQEEAAAFDERRTERIARLPVDEDLAEADLMAGLDEDDLRDMEGPDA